MPAHVLEKDPEEAARRLPALRRGFDYVVIDASAYEDEELIPLANMADRILLTTDHPRIDLGITRRVKMWLNIASLVQGKISVVYTRASRYARHRRDDAAYLQTVGLPLCKTVLRARSAYAYAFSRGVPVTVDDPTGFAATEIRQLAHEFDWGDDRPTRTVRDRRRTKDDRAYLLASMEVCHLPASLRSRRK